MTPLRVVLADDHRLLREGIRSLLRDMPGVEVVGEASNGQEALSLVEKHRPDLLITDIAMPGMNGLDLTSEVMGAFPETKVVILSMHLEEEYVHKAISVGAAGYLLKDSTTAELEMAVRAVVCGQVYLSPAVSKQLVKQYVSKGDEGQVPAEPLTARQRDILRLIAEGSSTKSIARRLGIGVKTVESHRYQLMQRLGIHEIAGLVRYAIRVGLVDPKK